MQVMEAVQNAVQNGIELLSKSVVNSNNQPIADGGDYRFNARTRQELIDSQQMAAESRGVDPRAQFNQLRDPAKQHLGAPDAEVVEPELRSASGLVLPSQTKRQARITPNEPIQNANPPVQRHDDGPVWRM